MITKDLLDKFNEQEKKINDLYIESRGIKCLLTRVKQSSTSAPRHDNDPFKISVKWESHRYGTIKDFEAEETRSILLLKEDFLFQTSSLEMLIKEIENDTFSNIQARITGEYIPTHSKIKFKEYPQYSFEIGDVLSYRKNGTILIYKLVRSF
jgi:hypothetical protein